MKQHGKNSYAEDYFEDNYALMRGGYSWEREKDVKEGLAKSIHDNFKPHTVLDIGCAKGFLVRALLALSIDAYGCDISAYALDHSDNASRGRLTNCDVRDGLPYKDYEFDVVVSDAVFEHVEDEYIIPVFKDIYRVVKNYFVLFVPVGLSMKNTPWGDPTHVNYMPPGYWVHKAWEAGFNFELRRSRHYADQTLECQNAELVFKKGTLIK